MKYRKKVISMAFLITLAILILLSLSACSCNGSQSSNTTQSSTASTTAALAKGTTSSLPTTSSPLASSSLSSGNVLVTSTDGNVSVTVPSGWNTNNTQLYPGSVIGVSNDASSEYLIITEKPKASLKASDTTNDYLGLVKIAFNLAVTNPVWGQPSAVTIGGCKGLTVKLTGKRKSNGTDTVYYVNVLESKNYFYNVCGYTLTSVESANKATLEGIINSFKEKD
jgi:hypothetical protein